MTTPNLTVEGTYSFSTRAPSILGTGYQNVIFEGMLNQAKAVKEFGHIAARYRQVFPLLPPGTPDRAGKTTYYLFRTISGEPICMAEEWIDMSTLTQVISERWMIEFQGSAVDMQRIRAFFAQSGLAFNIVQVNQ